ncbi:MAG: serine hydrolase [Nocardioides sp.]
MRLLRRIFLGLIVLLLVALVGGYWWQRPLLLTATGYAAHNACALENISHRDDPETDLPPNPLVPYLRTKTQKDGDQVAVTGSILGLLAKQTAYYTPGYGCTIGGERPELPEALEVGGLEVESAEPPNAEIPTAVATAFGDGLSDEEKQTLGTRAIVVNVGGVNVAERYAPGFSAATPQLGWSMSKSVTNLLVGRLVAEGKVALADDQLRKEWTDERADITIDDLLRMTSGLKWDETYALGTPITRMLYLEDDMGGYVASQPAAHTPGTYQQYSSGSTTLLCDILMDRAGSGSDLVRSELLADIGLSGFVVEPDHAGTPVCSSYMWATPLEWTALGRFALNEGVVGEASLLPEGWMKDSTTVKPVDKTEEVGYASGWWVNQLPDGSLVYPELPADAYWASGHDGQWLMIVPSADLVITRLGFSPEVEDEGVVALTASVIASLTP